MGYIRKVTQKDIEKAQKRCRLARLIFCKIPLYIGLGIVALYFILCGCNPVATLIVAVYTLWPFALIPLIAYFLTKDWRNFL